MHRSVTGSIGIGFLGCGDISTLHAAAIKECEGAVLVGLWNHREEDVAAGGALCVPV